MAPRIGRCPQGRYVSVEINGLAVAGYTGFLFLH
jgi:hypothetical protein